MKTLSISIAAYNMQDYLPRCLDSVLHPDVLDALEVLVINDGSKDDTLKIAQRYRRQYPGTVVVVDKPNGGHGSTVNKGIELATGRYFRLLDADDWFDTGEFIKLMRILEETDCDVVATHHCQEFVYENRSEEIKYENVEYGRIYSLADLDRFGRDWFDLASVHIRTEILQKNRVRIDQCFYSDIEFCMYIIPYIGTVMFLPNPVYRYFIGRAGQSISPESLNRNYKDLIRTSYGLIDFYLGHADGLSPIGYRMCDKILKNRICATYSILLRFDKPREEIVRFDSSIRDKSARIYRICGEELTYGRVVKPIRIWRRFGINIYASGVFRLAGNLRGRFRRRKI